MLFILANFVENKNFCMDPVQLGKIFGENVGRKLLQIFVSISQKMKIHFL